VRPGSQCRRTRRPGDVCQRAIAIIAPGMSLSQPTTRPGRSIHWTFHAGLDRVGITSRDTASTVINIGLKHTRCRQNGRDPRRSASWLAGARFPKRGVGKSRLKKASCTGDVGVESWKTKLRITLDHVLTPLADEGQLGDADVVLRPDLRASADVIKYILQSKNNKDSPLLIPSERRKS